MVYKINHQFNCGDKCLIYLLTCKTCLKQYVGQTVDEFQYRCNNYKRNDKKYLRGQSCFQQHIFEHFNNPGHKGFLEDVSVTFIDKTDPSDPEKREDYWIQTLETAAPWGLNIMEMVFVLLIYVELYTDVDIFSIISPFWTGFIEGQELWTRPSYFFIFRYVFNILFIFVFLVLS